MTQKEKNMGKKKCSGCFRVMCKEDKYCTYCGARPSKRLFLKAVPKADRSGHLTAVIYGPPLNFLFKCGSCGKEWEMFMKQLSYCPECGEESRGFDKEDK